MTERPEWILYAYDTRPDIELLRQILENKDSHIFYPERKLKAICLKYQALTTIPTAIEKTMTTEQLYNAQNPLWAREYTIEDLSNYMTYHIPANNYELAKTVIQMHRMPQSMIKFIQNAEYGVTERKQNDQTA